MFLILVAFQGALGLELNRDVQGVALSRAVSAGLHTILAVPERELVPLPEPATIASALVSPRCWGLFKYYPIIAGIKERTLGCTTFIIRGFDPLNDAIDYGGELIPRLRAGVGEVVN